MSDYFGALLRSAGTTVPPAVAPAVEPAPRQDDLVELDVAIDAEGLRTGPSNVAAPQVAAVPAGVDAPQASRTMRRAEATPRPASVAGQRAAGTVAQTASNGHDSGAASPPGRTQAAALHPRVQAALRWVATEPSTRVPQEPGQTQTLIGVAARQPQVRPPSAIVAARGPSPATAHGSPPAPQILRTEREARLPRVPPPVPARSAEPMPRPAPAATTRSPSVPEVHIGTIHVSVDAPPLVARAAPPTPPVAARPAGERSSFLRSRAPRL